MAITIRNLVKKYDQKTAVNNISFRLERGKPLAILGRNGSGKSTIIKIILGLKKQTGGECVIPKELKIGYLPEERGIYVDATVAEHLSLFGKLSGVKNVNEKIKYWLELLEIEQYRSFKLKYLSKGTAQKVQLAITLIHDPDLIILDEPFSGLDPVNTLLFYNIIKEHAKNKYLLISSHQMNQVEGLCEEVIFLNSGNAVAQGGISELKAIYGHSNVTIPYSPEHLEIVKEFNPRYDSKNIMIDLVENKGDQFRELIRKIADCPENIAYLKYDNMTLNDLFIRLLGV